MSDDATFCQLETIAPSQAATQAMAALRARKNKAIKIEGSHSAREACVGAPGTQAVSVVCCTRGPNRKPREYDALIPRHSPKKPPQQRGQICPPPRSVRQRQLERPPAGG